MKKINLILSAVAAVALFASCSNETPKEWTNVKNHDYTYTYTVTGSMTTTNKSGTTSSYSTNKTVQTIKQAVATVTYDEDALDGSNREYYTITIDGVANYVNTVTPAGATTANPSTRYTDDFGVNSYDWEDRSASINVPAGWYANATESGFDNFMYAIAHDRFWDEDPRDIIATMPTAVSTTENDPECVVGGGGTYDGTVFWFAGWSGTVEYHISVPVIEDLVIGISDFGGDYFIDFDKEFIALPEEAFDGFVGDDEFTLTYSTKKDNRLSYLSQTGFENAGNNLDTTDTEYSFTFKKVNVED